MKTRKDKFTDHHHNVKQLKQYLSPQRKRFSGIITDVVFDHLLAKHWLLFSNNSLTEFAQQRYVELQQLHHLMPESMQLMTTRMVNGNWLEAYQEVNSVDGAINGISRRIRFDNKLWGAAEEVKPAMDDYQQAFFSFFPELISYVELELSKLQKGSDIC